MLCANCKKNQATKSYELQRQGTSETKYYCLDCYYRLFIAPQTQRDIDATVCAYCGTTLAELKKRNLVGCAKCYETLHTALMPAVEKVQKSTHHTGKNPVGSNSDALARRCDELKTIVEKLNSEKNFVAARAYTERLVRLQGGTDEEEDYVWRKHRHSLKQS